MSIAQIESDNRVEAAGPVSEDSNYWKLLQGYRDVGTGSRECRDRTQEFSKTTGGYVCCTIFLVAIHLLMN